MIKSCLIDEIVCYAKCFFSLSEMLNNAIKVLMLHCCCFTSYMTLYRVGKYEPHHEKTCLGVSDKGSVRSSPNGTIGNFTNGTIGSQWYHWLTNVTNGTDCTIGRANDTIGITIGTNGITNGTIG